MAHFTFYRQMRVDGGVRTGLETSSGVELETFEPGSDDDDPALLWWVDLRGQGVGIPQEPDLLREWLTARGPEIRDALYQSAERLAAGVDHGSWPFQVGFPQLWPGVDLTVAGSALRRIDAMTIAETLRDLGCQWQSLLARLAPEAVSV